MTNEYVPIKLKKEVKEKLVVIQGELMSRLRRKVSLSDVVDYLITAFRKDY